MKEPLVTWEEAEALAKELGNTESDADELLIRFIERWSERTGSPVRRDAIVRPYRGLRGPLRGLIKQTLYLFERRDGFTRTKLLLLELGVVPEALGALDEDVRTARSNRADSRESFAGDCEMVVFNAITGYSPWYQDRWSDKQMEMRMGGVPTVMRKLRHVPSLFVDCLKEARGVQQLHLLHHFGIVPREPPLYDFPEHAPDDYVPPEP